MRSFVPQEDSTIVLLSSNNEIPRFGKKVKRKIIASNDEILVPQEHSKEENVVESLMLKRKKLNGISFVFTMP